MVEKSLTTRRVLFLKSKGLNSSQIRYVCKVLLKLDDKQIDNKIIKYVKNQENKQARKIMVRERVVEQMQLYHLL